MSRLRSVIRQGPAQHRAGLFFALPLVLAVASVCGATTPSAQVRATSDYLMRMDADHDGRVSLPEYQAWLSYGFERMDRNGDGVLSTSELPGGRGRPVRLDAHRAALAEAFARQDRNRDGSLDARELAAPPR
ncbi:EF-hand domain-containing protein [Lysobacter korlensis]|uniref:EF-hand domain-containing protein n=1 Tax=Lysobacter korlensis TaxID=553636 RepID=A0ABV6RK72_9GAMM